MREDWKDKLTEDLEELFAEGNGARSAGSSVKLEPGDRRFVTVMILDLKGFSVLTENFDSEFVSKLMKILLTRFRKVLEQREGVVEKLEGDSILVGFGTGPAHEDDALRAIDAGLEILSALKKVQPVLKKRDIKLPGRIGVDSGEVTISVRAGETVLTGDAVVTAARLEENAPSNCLLVSETSRLLAGENFKYVKRPPIIAKGKSHPIESFIVVRKLSRPARWMQNQKVGKTRFVGRNEELETLMGIFRDYSSKTAVIAERPQAGKNKHFLIGIEGEAGIGKSRLVDEFLHRTIENEAGEVPGVLTGYAAGFAPRPYEMIISIMLDYFGLTTFGPEVRVRLDSLPAALSEYAEDETELQKAVPVMGFLLGEKYPNYDFSNYNPSRLQVDIFIAIRTFIEALASQAFRQYERPLILVWDDFHWADRPTSDTMKYVLENAKTPLPLINLVLYRPGAVLPEPSASTVEQLLLGVRSLKASDETALIRGLLGEGNIPAPVIRMIQKKGSGNPYFIEQLVFHLMEREVIKRTNGDWRITEDLGSLEIPSTLKSLLVSRIDALDRESRRIIQHASVIGAEFLYSTLKYMEDRLEDGIDPSEPLEKLVANDYLLTSQNIYKASPSSDLISPAQYLTESCSDGEGHLEKTFGEKIALNRPNAAFFFRHALIRDAAYDNLLHQNRKVLHYLCAEAIEDIHSDNTDNFAFQLGEHWLKAGRKSHAVEYFYRAGDLAANSGDCRAALTAFSKVFDLLSEDDLMKAQVLRRRGEIYQRIGEIDKAERDFYSSLHIAEATNDKKNAAYAVLAVGNLEFFQGKREEALQRYRYSLEIFRQINDKEGQCRSINGIGRIHRVLNQPEKALDFFHQALKLSRIINDKRQEGALLNNIGGVYFLTRQIDEALEYSQKALKIHVEIGSRWGEARSMNNIGNVCFIKRKYNSALHCYRQYYKISRDMAHKLWQGEALNNMGLIMQKTGNYKKALEFSLRSRNISRELGAKYEEAMSDQYIGSIHMIRHEFDQALALFHQALKILRKLNRRFEISDVILSLGSLYISLGRFDTAEKHISKGLKLCKEIGNKYGESFALLHQSIIARSRGDRLRSAELLQEYGELCRLTGNREGDANSLFYSGLLLAEQGKFEECLQNYQAYMNFIRESGALLKQSTCLIEIGNVHYLRSDYQTALTKFKESAEIREKLELPHLLILPLSMHARCLFKTRRFSEALELSEKAATGLEENDNKLLIRETAPEQILYTHYLALNNQENPESEKLAHNFLKRSYEILQSYCRDIENSEHRSNILNAAMNREIVESWKKNQEQNAQ